MSGTDRVPCCFLKGLPVSDGLCDNDTMCGDCYTTAGNSIKMIGNGELTSSKSGAYTRDVQYVAPNSGGITVGVIRDGIFVPDAAFQYMPEGKLKQQLSVLAGFLQTTNPVPLTARKPSKTQRHGNEYGVQLKTRIRG